MTTPELGVWAKPTLVGSLVTLRPYAPADGDGAWEMVQDPEGQDLTGTTATFTREQIQENTGWKVAYATTVEETPPPTKRELDVLRDLQARTRRAQEAA